MLSGERKELKVKHVSMSISMHVNYYNFYLGLLRCQFQKTDALIDMSPYTHPNILRTIIHTQFLPCSGYWTSCRYLLCCSDDSPIMKSFLLVLSLNYLSSSLNEVFPFVLLFTVQSLFFWLEYLVQVFTIWIVFL